MFELIRAPYQTNLAAAGLEMFPGDHVSKLIMRSPDSVGGS